MPATGTNHEGCAQWATPARPQASKATQLYTYTHTHSHSHAHTHTVTRAHTHTHSRAHAHSHHAAVAGAKLHDVRVIVDNAELNVALLWRVLTRRAAEGVVGGGAVCVHVCVCVRVRVCAHARACVCQLDVALLWRILVHRAAVGAIGRGGLQLVCGGEGA